MPDPVTPTPPDSMRASLATLIDIVADGVIVVDRGGTVRYLNAGAIRLFGHPAEAIIGQPLERLLPGHLAVAHRHHLREFADGPVTTRWMNERAEVTGRRADGSEFPAEITIAKWDGAEGLLLAAVVRDVTERERLHRREQLLARAGQRLAETLEVPQTMEAVVEAAVPSLGEWAVLDLLAAAPGRQEMLRACSRHDTLRVEGALRGLERRPLDPDAPSQVIDVLRTGQPRLVDPVDDDWLERHSAGPEELTLLRQLAPRALLIAPVPGHDRVIGALTIGVSTSGRSLPPDLHEAAEGLAAVAGLELSNAILYQAAEQALVGRDRVLEIVAHDLRNLSSASRMCAIALEADTGADPAVRRELYATIRESSEAIHRLVGDLLDLAAIESGQLTVRPEPAAPAAIITATTSLFRERAAAAGIALTTALPPSLPELALDRDRLVQALANLLHNALKFTQAGGRITVSAELQPDAVVISVADTGVGIAADTLATLLRAEWRAAAGPGGSGLGLPITKGIVVAHGGTLDASSRPGHGTTFRIILPLQH